MKQLPLKAVAPIISVLLFVLPVHAAPIPSSQQADGWERAIDTEKPVLNASVYDGTLSIEVVEKGSGVKAIYVNGYEFTDFEDGKLDIRLSRFDAAYEFFTVSAIDSVGNMSATYRVRNPYYEDPDSEDDEEGLDELLPIEAGPTDPTEATAVVTDYDTANEFYTITAASGKVFYLIIDRTEDEETVYFLTEISENDLLNVTSDTEETLPRNTAVEDSAIPVSTLITSGAQVPAERSSSQPASGSERSNNSSQDSKPDIKEKVDEIKKNPAAGYILMGIAGVIFFVFAYYFKVVKKRQERDLSDEDETDESEYDDGAYKEDKENDGMPGPTEEDAADSTDQ